MIAMFSWTAAVQNCAYLLRCEITCCHVEQLLQVEQDQCFLECRHYHFGEQQASCPNKMHVVLCDALADALTDALSRA